MSEAPVKTCFVIGPIGDPGSITRRDADWLLKGIIQPILKEKFKFEVQRADEIARPGMIDSQVINAVIDADLVIADLSENNPNAFYELAIRHMEGRPVIHMTRERNIPFDVKPYRTIPFSNASYENVENAKLELEKQVKEAISPHYEVDNPITTARGKKKWKETATDKDKVILDLLNSISDRIPHSERHESLLARGYVVVRNGVARVLTTAAEISAGDPLDLEFHDGRVGVVAGSRPRLRARRTGAAPGQGS
jgi:hypothetical protein